MNFELKERNCESCFHCKACQFANAIDGIAAQCPHFADKSYIYQLPVKPGDMVFEVTITNNEYYVVLCIVAAVNISREVVLELRELPAGQAEARTVKRSLDVWQKDIFPTDQEAYREIGRRKLASKQIFNNN